MNILKKDLKPNEVKATLRRTFKILWSLHWRIWITCVAYMFLVLMTFAISEIVFDKALENWFSNLLDGEKTITLTILVVSIIAFIIWNAFRQTSKVIGLEYKDFCLDFVPQPLLRKKYVRKVFLRILLISICVDIPFEILMTGSADDASNAFSFIILFPISLIVRLYFICFAFNRSYGDIRLSLLKKVSLLKN